MENIHVDVRVERVKNQSKCMCGVAFLVNFITVCVFECFFSCSFNPVFRSSLWYKQKWSITNSSIEEWQTSSRNIQKCDSGLYSIASVDLLINNQKQFVFLWTYMVWFPYASALVKKKSYLKNILYVFILCRNPGISLIIFILMAM